ncbi:tetratricopeptide repeat protein [Vibrio scophthalmi]|uniref:MalT-like TPR region domain-containing protein n=1 Tax=Vibrio scophthalmi TaxID=45658 RepID=A0A1E3WHI2_9VIBR|nr:hypothetical protein [Vibrio scophthalmi]ODS05261.1 hypothetical protein VSF3289_04402 [Vibrio scophthalmi]
MDKSQHLLEVELGQLKSRIESEPEQVLLAAEQCATRANQILFPRGVVQSLVIISRCYWALMDYRKGLKTIREAYTKLSQVDNDDDLPEILHLHALHFWGQAKYYSAQQYWIQSLEQSALVDQVEIQIESLIGLGNVWRVLGEYELALSTHELSVKVANNMRIYWLEGKARILLAWDHYLIGHYIDMLSILDSAEEALLHHDDRTWQAEIWDFRGLALLGLERIDDAEKATQKAQQLVEQNNLTWMKAHAYISQARLELMRKEPSEASQLLIAAERTANGFDNGELLSQIYFQQSRVAEEVGDFVIALQAFKKYRTHSTEMLREQTVREGSDKARASKRTLEQRAKKLIKRIRAQHEYDPDKHMSQMVSETFWWEQMMLFKTELKRANHVAIIIHHPNNKCLDICAELTHSFCNHQDLLSRLSTDKLGLLLAEKGDDAHRIFQVLTQMFEMYPWKRRGIKLGMPQLSFYDILTFPFTLEQLEQEPVVTEL